MEQRVRGLEVELEEARGQLRKAREEAARVRRQLAVAGDGTAGSGSSSSGGRGGGGPQGEYTVPDT